MRTLCALLGLFLAVAIANCGPVVKREAEEDLSPLNEVYVFEVDGEDAADGERSDRDKRKIGIKLGVTNGIINFVFGKIDSFLDAKTRALDVLDDSNRAKNAVFGIDSTQSATTQFLSNLVSQKIQAATGSIGPVINSATTLLSGASAGLSNAFASKLAPLSSLSGGLSGGAGASAGAGVTAGGGTAGGSGTVAGSAIIGDLLTSKITSLSSLSQSSGGLSGGTGSGDNAGSGGGASAGSAAGANAGAGINLFANLAGRAATTTTTEDTPVFDRTRVSLEVPSRAFGTGFTLITNVSKILNSVILNSARRTQTLLEIFKPFFRGTFAIKGLPSDNPR